MTIFLLTLFSLPMTLCNHILIFDQVSFCNMRSAQVEGVIHFENDIEELQQWDDQVMFFNTRAQCLHLETVVFLIWCC